MEEDWDETSLLDMEDMVEDTLTQWTMDEELYVGGHHWAVAADADADADADDCDDPDGDANPDPDADADAQAGANGDGAMINVCFGHASIGVGRTAE